jgi:hypothetical protein
MFATRPRRSIQPNSQPRMGYTVIPPSVRGLNLKAGINALKPDEALVLDNWRPGQTYQQARGGYTSQATGLGSTVGTLMEWAGPASRKFFGAVATAIYDITSSGAVGAAAVSSLGSAYWQHINFTTSGGSFLVLANGTDSVRNYDGTSWTTPSITNVSSADLINVASHKQRLWFIEKTSTNAWYLGTSSISGAATKFTLGDKFRRGGKLQLIGTLSQDSGDGLDDVLCFVSSNGEVVVYQGGNPDDPNDWSLVGVYRAGAPIGNRALIRVGGDLGILTERGIISVQQLMQGGVATAERQAITDKIDPGIIDAFKTYGTNTGWEMVVHERTRQALVNVPKSAATAFQYALNIQTGAWSTYGLYASPLNATTWGISNNELYFGDSSGNVWHAENGYQDNGAAITCTWKPSYQKYGKGQLYRVSLIQPIFIAGGRITPAVRVNVDYRDDQPMTTDEYPVDAGSAGSVWGTGLWGTAIWGDSHTPYADWINADGVGTASTVNMVIRPNGIAARLSETNVRYELSQVPSL